MLCKLCCFDTVYQLIHYTDWTVTAHVLVVLYPISRSVKNHFCSSCEFSMSDIEILFEYLLFQVQIVSLLPAWQTVKQLYWKNSSQHLFFYQKEELCHLQFTALMRWIKYLKNTCVPLFKYRSIHFNNPYDPYTKQSVPECVKYRQPWSLPAAKYMVTYFFKQVFSPNF